MIIFIVLEALLIVFLLTAKIDFPLPNVISAATKFNNMLNEIYGIVGNSLLLS